MFIKINVSFIKLYLMYESRGVSVVKLGVWFTSNKTGYN
jgi:hypothetical protein